MHLVRALPALQNLLIADTSFLDGRTKCPHTADITLPRRAVGSKAARRKPSGLLLV